MQEALNRADMLEDMDTQLRNQLEKMILQRNQCSAEKAQRDLEVGFEPFCYALPDFCSAVCA